MEELRLATVESRFADIIWTHEPVPSGELVKLAEAELEPFDAWLDETGKILRARPWYLRAVYKWILAVL